MAINGFINALRWVDNQIKNTWLLYIQLDQLIWWWSNYVTCLWKINKKFAAHNARSVERILIRSLDMTRTATHAPLELRNSSEVTQRCPLWGPNIQMTARNCRGIKLSQRYHVSVLTITIRISSCSFIVSTGCHGTRNAYSQLYFVCKSASASLLGNDSRGHRLILPFDGTHWAPICRIFDTGL